MEKETKKKAIIAATVTGLTAIGGAGYALYKRSKKGTKKRPILVPIEEEVVKTEKKPKITLLKGKKSK